MAKAEYRVKVSAVCAGCGREDSREAESCDSVTALMSVGLPLGWTTVTVSGGREFQVAELCPDCPPTIVVRGKPLHLSK